MKSTKFTRVRTWSIGLTLASLLLTVIQSSGVAQANGLYPALNPEFGTPTRTVDGFSVSITNYDPNYTWATPTVSAGSGSGSVTSWRENTTSSVNGMWRSVTSSSDGTKLAAVAEDDYVYTSSNSGATWTQRVDSGSRVWKSITSSSDGTKLAAVVNGGYIYTSSNSGATWTEQTDSGERSWWSIASSSDGTKLAAVAAYGYIYTSDNSGATWTARTEAGSRYWHAIASNDDGTKLAAVVTDFGYIYTSDNSGATWTEQTQPGMRSWVSIASNSDGTKLAAVAVWGSVYTSTDSGENWTERAEPGNRYWTSISSSSDGSRLALATPNGYLYTSSDSGATWIQDPLYENWAAVALNSDGTKFIAFSGSSLLTKDPATLYVTGLNPGQSATITQTTSRDGYTEGTGTVAGTALDGAALNPAFGDVIRTADGFSVAITNLNPDYTWAEPTVTAGTITLTMGNGWSDNSQSSDSESWRAIASSSDGTKLAAVEHNGLIRTSTDSGLTWTVQEGSVTAGYRGIASSSDGTKLAAVALSENIYTSNDSGVTWTEQPQSGQRTWSSITSSSDGTKLAAVDQQGYIYTSADSGATWTEQLNSDQRDWRAITSSSDGTKLAAVDNEGYIYTSTDYGVNWTAQTGSGERSWFAIASSSDGAKLAAVENDGYIYTSTDSGATWTERSGAGSRDWRAIASSSDGTKLAAAADNGSIYLSTDSGATWTEQADTENDWYGIASSSDGTKLAAAPRNSYITTFSPTYLNVTGLAPGASATITQTTSRTGYSNGSNSVTGTALDADAPDTTISIPNISIAAPVTGATPVTSISSNGQYTVTIAWNGSPSTFASNTIYTATVTVVPDSGYTLSGVAADFFTVNGAPETSGNPTNAGSFTQTFAATATTISTATISITAPATGATPVTSTSSNGQFSTTVTWSPADDRFRSNTVYTATITVTPDSGYTLNGVNANFFTIDGASSVTNDPDSGVVTAVFAATGGKLAQTINFNALNSMTRASNSQALSATTTATGGYSVSFTTSTPSICSISNGAVVQTALGTCVITASQAGDDIYLAADPVVRSFAIAKGSQTITISALNPMTLSSYDQTLVATSSASLSPITFSTSSPACSIVNGKLRAVAVGTCSIVASQAGNSNFAPASAVRSGFVIGKDSQTITFTQPTSMRIGDADRTLNATSSAGLTPVFTSQTPSICSVVAGKIRALSSGSCVIASNQAGNANILPAQRVLRVVTIRR